MLPTDDKRNRPWWVVPDMKIRKHFFLEQSRDIRKYRFLRKQRMLYRFALGQPNPREFVRELTLKALQMKLVTENSRN